MADFKRNGKEAMSQEDEAEIRMEKRARIPVIETESETAKRVKKETKEHYKAILLMMKNQKEEMVEDCFLYGELQEKRGMLMAIEKVLSTPDLNLREEAEKLEKEVIDADHARSSHKVSEIDWLKIDCSWMI